MRRFFNLAFLAFVATASTVQAQTNSLSLTGSVQSEAKEPLAGAAITIIHIPSGTRSAAASDGAGNFAVQNLLAGGPYVVQVGEGGYRPQTVENIFLETGKPANISVVLSKLGAGAGKTRSPREQRAASAAAKPAEPAPLLTASADPQAKILLPAPAVPARAAVPQPTISVSAAGQPGTATTPPPSPEPAATAPAAGAPRPSRYPSYRVAATRVSDLIVPGHFDAKTGNYVYDTGKPTTLQLPGGAIIPNVGALSTESNLYHFLSDPQAQVDTVNLTRGWYNFDRVYFDAGKASLTTESVNQLRNVAALLKAYPKARIKIGGYTDSTGTYKINRQLSEDRARTAWESLVEMGISPSRIETRGYGPRYSIAGNTTEEGRAMNRRLSVKVLQK